MLTRLDSHWYANCFAGNSDEDVPLVMIDLADEVDMAVPAAASTPTSNTDNTPKQRQPTNINGCQSEDDNDTADQRCADGRGTNTNACVWDRIADATDDISSLSIEPARRSAFATSVDSPSCLRDPRASPSLEQVERLVPVVRTVLATEGVEVARARSVRDIL